MKNICDKEMLLSLTESTEESKSHKINPGFHLIDNEASAALKTTMVIINIK